MRYPVGGCFILSKKNIQFEGGCYQMTDLLPDYVAYIFFSMLQINNYNFHDSYKLNCTLVNHYYE